MNIVKHTGCILYLANLKEPIVSLGDQQVAQYVSLRAREQRITIIRTKLTRVTGLPTLESIDIFCCYANMNIVQHTGCILYLAHL